MRLKMKLGLNSMNNSKLLMLYIYNLSNLQSQKVLPLKVEAFMRNNYRDKYPLCNNDCLKLTNQIKILSTLLLLCIHKIMEVSIIIAHIQEGGQIGELKFYNAYLYLIDKMNIQIIIIHIYLFKPKRSKNSLIKSQS